MHFITFTNLLQKYNRNTRFLLEVNKINSYKTQRIKFISVC